MHVMNISLNMFYLKYKKLDIENAKNWCDRCQIKENESRLLHTFPIHFKTYCTTSIEKKKTFQESAEQRIEHTSPSKSKGETTFETLLSLFQFAKLRLICEYGYICILLQQLERRQRQLFYLLPLSSLSI